MKFRKILKDNGYIYYEIDKKLLYSFITTLSQSGLNKLYRELQVLDTIN